MRVIEPLMHPMHVPTQQAQALACIECRRPWLDAGERWRLKVTDEQPPETVPYCPQCATREFGPARSRDRISSSPSNGGPSGSTGTPMRFHDR
jgi:hypothetical protein